MPEKLLQPEWAPDFGERKIHPTAGITAIGARPPLVAFNVNLATSDVQIAKKIAKVIRASSGGFKACKAMGFMLEDRGIAQVSMPWRSATEHISSEANWWGLRRQRHSWTARNST